MNRHDLILQEQHLREIEGQVLAKAGVEGAAYIIFGTSEIAEDPWSRTGRTRLLSRQVVAIPPDDILEAEADHITWSTASIVKLLRRAKQDNTVVGIVHSHPHGPGCFSAQDTRNESELVRLAGNRNGPGTRLVSLLLTGEGQLCARVWRGVDDFDECNKITVVGRRIAFHGHAHSVHHDMAEAFSRQALAFGAQTNAQLRNLRIGVVGCGGTGSATAMLLARLGVGQLVLFDDDIVEASNLNRLHGATRSDADAMRTKVEVLVREISDLGLGVKVAARRGWIGDEACRDALKSCDIVFGCTDDNDGRMLLNRFAYFYLIPIIDMGLAIAPLNDGRQVKELSGRTTVLVPHAPCLMCRGIVDPVLAREESLKRSNPAEHERQKREAYVRGGGNPAPAVVTFTTATACMAVDELLQGLTDFRGTGGWAWQRVRRFDLMQDRTPGAPPNPDCPICTETDYWGLGDVSPFLDRAG